MTAALLLTLSLLLLAAALLTFALGLFGHARQTERNSHALQSAIDLRAPSHGSPREPNARTSARHYVLQWLASVGERVGTGSLGKALLAPEDRILLEQAGRNTAHGRAIFIGLRLVLAASLPLLALLWLRPRGLTEAIELIGAFAMGVLLPKFALRGWAARVCKRAEDELPLLIDLLRLLQGVGFSIDQSLQMIAERFQPVLPVLGKEIHDANVAYMHGRARAQSLRRLAEAYANDDLQSLVQMMLQVHQHGGAVQEPLRQFGERLREQRKSAMKERTGKLSVKMTVVMMLTLLPALMAVLAGPAIVALASTMSKLQGP
ncbi:MAG: type II secretion system F family protein [Dyella sp.]